MSLNVCIRMEKSDPLLAQTLKSLKFAQNMSELSLFNAVIFGLLCQMYSLKCTVEIYLNLNGIVMPGCCYCENNDIFSDFISIFGARLPIVGWELDNTFLRHAKR